MSTATIDYDALAAQSGGTAQAAPVDYDALAAQHGGTAAEAAQPEQHGFLYNAGKRVLDNFISPVMGGVSMAQGTPEQAAAAGLNAINSGLQFIAPGADPYMRTVENAQSEHPYANLAGDAATIGLTAAGAAGGDAVPTRAKAAALFNEVRNAAGDQPVSLTRSQAPLERIAQLTDAGGPVMNAPNKLLTRSQTINPISYNEARDFYSNLSQLSASDKMNMNGPMKKAVGELASAFKQDIGDTATAAGKGEQYNQAMKQYRQAMQIHDAIGTAIKYGLPGVAGSAALYPALRALWDLIK